MSEDALDAAIDAFEESTGQPPNDYDVAVMKAAIAEESDAEDGE